MAATSSELALIVTAKNRATAALRGVSKDLQGVDKQVSRTGKAFGAMRKVGNAAFLGLGVAVAGFVVKGVSDFVKFEDRMTQSLAIMGKEAQSWRGVMEDAARKVALTTTFSAEQAAESYFFLASAGLDAEQSIAALPQVAAFAQAGMFDMALATDLATDAQSALGLTSKDAGTNLENMTRVTDVLVKANTLANASVQQFSESLTNKAGAAIKIVNKDLEEGVAVLAAFADQGIKGSEAGTAFNIVMRELQTKALKNTDAFKEFNIEVFDSQGKMANLGDIVGDLEGALEGMSDEQKKATLRTLGFNDKAVIFIQTLIGTSEKIKQYEEDLRTAGGMTKEVADNQLESLKSQFQLLGSQVTDVGLDLGETLVPILLQLGQNVLPVIVEWLKNFVAGIQAVIGWINGLPGPVKVAIGVIGLLGTALLLLSAHPVFLAIAAIGGVVALIGANARESKRKVDILKTALETLGRLKFDNIKDLFSEDDIRRLEEAGVTYEELILAIEEGGDAMEVVREKVEETFAGKWGWDSNFYEGIMGDLGDLHTQWNDNEQALVDYEIARATADAKEGEALVNLQATRTEQVFLNDAIHRSSAAWLEAYVPAIDDSIEATHNLVLENQNLASELLALADPVFAAINSFGNLKGMLEGVNEISDLSAEKQLAIAKATLEVGAQFDALDPSQINAAIGGVAAALGTSRERAEELLVELGLLDGLTVAARVEVKVVADRVTVGGKDLVKVFPGGIEAFEHGGFIRKGQTGLVGEDGAELFTPTTSGFISPSGSFSSNEGAGEVNIHLHGVDLSEGSRRVLEEIREGIRQLDREDL